MSISFSLETSNDVIGFLKKNALISLTQDKDLEKMAHEQKLNKLEVLLKYFPENDEQITVVLHKLYKLPQNKFIINKGDALFSLGEFVMLKRSTGETELVCFDPQTITDYFNYFLPNTFILSRSAFEALDAKKLPTAAKEDISMLMVQSADVKITGAEEIVQKNEAEEDISEDAVKQLDKIIRESITQDVSDIHIEVDSDDSEVIFYRVRLRVDGILKEVHRSNNMSVYSGILSQIKLRSGLKLDENRLPQDGRMAYSIFGKVYSFRVSTKPIVVADLKKGGESTAEKIVIRKMPDVNNISLKQLGYHSYAVHQIQAAADLANGFNIITGPTGSGKTTLLYAILGEIDTITKNVSTIEDPVEAEIKNVNQTQVMTEIGLDFSRVLRAELRQDPDIIMVGEMRDRETAEIAAEASLTGHLVFSTLHTKNAVSTITRLINMGLPSFIVGSALSYSVAQRLIRKLCPHCKQKMDDTSAVEKEFLEPVLKKVKNKEVKKVLEEEMKKKDMYKKVGCKQCFNTGYMGRTAVIEVFKLNESCEEIILKQDANEVLLQNIAEETGMMTIEQDGLIKVMQGVTSIEELYSVLISD